MKRKKKFDWFALINYTFLIASALICVIPMLNIVAISFSSGTAVRVGSVSLWPVDANLNAYRYILAREPFWRSMLVSLKRILLGGSINMLLTIVMAYPLSRDKSVFKARTFYVWYFFFTTLFGGGMIPSFLVVNDTKIMNTIWALVLPGAVPVFNIILLLNFYRQMPREIEEAAWMDGISHWGMLWRMYVPTSTPAIATLTLFVLVGHWNAWFDGMIYMKHPDNYPLQTYLRNLIALRQDAFMDLSEMKKSFDLSDRTLRSAQIFVGALPILAVYPFLQRYFTKGIVLGSVKG